jgi:RHS repeat-associated protein
MPMPGRKYQASNRYRYGFNGKENDPETVGTGSGTQDYGMRIYNPALGKFLSVDPLQKEFAWNSSYAFAENDVVRSIDLDGAERNFVFFYKDKSGTAIHTTVPYSQVHPGQAQGPLGNGEFEVVQNEITKQFSGKYRESYEDANPIRSTVQKIEKKMQNSPPFVAVEVGGKTSERIGPLKLTQNASYTDDGKSLKGKVKNEGEISTVSGSKISVNASLYIKVYINKPVDNAVKATITVPLPDNLYMNTTYRLNDGKCESIEIGVGAKPSEPQVEIKEKIVPLTGQL